MYVHGAAWFDFISSCMYISCVTYAFHVHFYSAEDATLNALNVSALDPQNLSKYSAGPCELTLYMLRVSALIIPTPKGRIYNWTSS